MRNVKGFTLIEQMITLLVSSVAILGIAKMQSTLASSELLAKQRVEAISFTQNVLENLRQSEYPPVYNTATPVLSGNTPVNTIVFCDDTKVSLCSNSSTAKYTATHVITAGSGGLQYTDVSVTTVWTTKSESNSVNLTTKIPNTSPEDSGSLMLGKLSSNMVNVGGSPNSSGVTPVVLTVDSSGSGGSSGGTPKSNNGNGSNSTSCTAQNITSSSCSYTVLDQANNWSGTVSTTTQGRSGTATASCTNGNWALTNVVCTATNTYACALTATITIISFSGTGNNKVATWGSTVYSLANGQPSACSSIVPSSVSSKCVPSTTVSANSKVNDTSTCSYTTNVTTYQ